MPYERKRRPPVGMGITLRAYRKEHDLSQQELADMCGLNHSAISRIEGGSRTKIQVDTLLKLSQAMGITLDELVATSQTEAATA